MIALANTLKYCIAKAKACDKTQALGLVSELFAKDLELDAGFILDKIYARENLVTTGLGEGFALPHCRIKECLQPITVLITLDKAIDFAARDGKPVDVLFALVAPEYNHLELLSQIAYILSNKISCQKLRAAQTADELFQIIKTQKCI